jgi:acetoacetate decarboxylase
VAEVSGFFYPRTATGRSSLLPPPPWHYSGDLLTVEYRTDPARVAELLPGPLQPAPEDPGAVALIWADWQSCGDSGDELLDPVRAQGAPDALDELVRSGSASVEAGPAWSGEATLELFESPTEELARLEVGEIIGGYYQQVGVTWDGGKVLRS